MHHPVLVSEIVEALQWSDSTTVIADLTVGGGCHLEALLKTYPLPAKIYALDQDAYALERSRIRLKDYPVQYFHSNFRQALSVLPEPVDRMLVDLGVSSFQLDHAERGFSFQKDGPLDMRMDTSRGETALEWLYSCRQEDFLRILRDYGEEPRASWISKRWIQQRSKSKIRSIRDFLQVFGMDLDSRDRRGKHPMTRTFQALRIQINDELGVLTDLIRDLPSLLKKGGCVAILTFHSLEDREVKWGLKGRLRPVNKKVILPTREEVRIHPRSRSAKLRIYERGADDS